MTVKQEQEWLEAAREQGRDAAKAAASWVVDGNTKTEAIPAVLAMFDEGDPQVFDYLPALPDLSGEWADAPTPQSLAHDIIGEPVEPTESGAEFLTAIAEAWEEGRDEVFEQECERLLRAALPEQEGRTA